MERYLFTERCSLSRALQPSLKIPSERTPPRFPNGPLQRETRLKRFLLHLSLKVPGKWAPSYVLQQGPYGERSFISRDSGLFIHLYLSHSPIRSPSTKNGENNWSPSTEPHVDRRPTYMGCGLVPQGNRLRHCYLYPSAMQPSARNFPLWLG